MVRQTISENLMGGDMERILTGAALLVVAFGIWSGAALADNDERLVVNRNAAQQFAALPAGVRFPEGITADPKSGDVFVGTFDAPPNNNPNKLLRFGRNGRLEASRDFGNTPLLGLEFDRANRKVYIAAVGDFSGTGSRIQRIAAGFDGATAIEDVAVIPAIGAPAPRIVNNPDGSVDTITFGSGARVPNALAFDSQGRLYISDSFQGAIFRIDNPNACAPACAVDTVAHDPLLATAGFPPFGANGIAVNRDETALFIANTGDDRIVRLDLGTGVVAVFAESINGADGIAFDKRGRLWVAANQADEVVGLNAVGRVVAKLGDSLGVRNGSPRGLLFPASLVIVDDEMFVTNLALPLNGVAGDEPEEDVKRHTVSRIRLPHH
jgi:DNA-binding beta-propeller fold protein YncE